MRRALSLTSLGLVFLGLELSTAALSTIVARLSAGMAALASGTEGIVPAPLFVTGALFLTIGLAVGGLVLWAGREEVRVESVGRRCPDCGARTRRVRRNWYHRLISQLVREPLALRRCTRCGWTGLSLKS